MNFGNLQGQLGGLLGSLTGKQQQQQQQAPYGQYPGQQAQQPYQPQYGQYPGSQAQQQYPGQPQTSYGLPYQQQPPQQGFSPPPPPQQPMLPPGWIAQWNAQYQRNFYVETATGKSQWEAPTFAPPPVPPPTEFAAPAGPPPGSSVGAPGEKVTLADHYNLNAEPGAAPVLQTPQQQQQGNPLFIPANATVQHHSGVPIQPAVGTVDPTVAIALELSQHVPSLMKAPPAGSKPEVLDGWRRYLREIQDAQTNHTRAIRDAQIEHDRRVKDAHYQDQQYKLNSASTAFSSIMSHSITNMGYAVQSQDAQIDYNRTVEHAHQTMNDQVERANRNYEDVLRYNI
ncbi:hypothetical protein HDU79_007890 [Rhizoclosmatium sp. JEL0117]|nr:hypothetical protein HDU79_007890 [Rhizoclosmatium sp. JEL0117]